MAFCAKLTVWDRWQVSYPLRVAAAPATVAAAAAARCKLHFPNAFAMSDRKAMYICGIQPGRGHVAGGVGQSRNLAWLPFWTLVATLARSQLFAVVAVAAVAAFRICPAASQNSLGMCTQLRPFQLHFSFCFALLAALLVLYCCCCCSCTCCFCYCCDYVVVVCTDCCWFECWLLLQHNAVGGQRPRSLIKPRRIQARVCGCVSMCMCVCVCLCVDCVYKSRRLISFALSDFMELRSIWNWFNHIFSFK